MFSLSLYFDSAIALPKVYIILISSYFLTVKLQKLKAK